MTLGRSLARAGHEVVFASDELHEPHDFKFYPLPIHRANTSTWGRARNVFALRKILEDEKFDVVHSHSRAANLIVHLARKTPYVTTVHGRWRNTFAFRNFPCLGRRTIAMCPYLKRYLSEDIGIPEEKVRMAPNGIDCDRFSPAGNGRDRSVQAQRPVVLYVGRSSGQKGTALRFMTEKVIKNVLRRFPDVEFKTLTEQRAGPPPSMPELYRSARVVVGAGRVVLEAMACGIPAVAIGESSAPGLLREEYFEQAFDSNFGDCGVWNMFLGREGRLIEDLDRVLSDAALREKLSAWGRGMVLKKFDAEKIAPSIAKIYEEAVSA
ncbi:MAG: hypothetical protein A3A86_04245 [Elusimicrobia bacterium RIFCSPLOWO2_01_FULL_60_11]|nr:MAG: hypothetical protein A3A86_04245 [Elusimicrobia bacterium RIFCSPLOWO2_01_FULL_60_11]